MKNSDDSKPLSEFERFREFTRHIVSVPKQEADELAQKLAAQKSKPKQAQKRESS